MDPVSIAPAPAATAPEAATPRPAAEEGAPGAKPFGEALKQELAKPQSSKADAKAGTPKSDAPKSDTPKSETAQSATAKPDAAKSAATTPPANPQSVTPEWAALLESAGVAEEADADLGDDTALAEIAPGAENAPADALVATTPIHPLVAVPAQTAASTPGLGLGQGNRGAIDARLRAETFDAVAAQGADATQSGIDTPGAAPSEAESLVSAFSGERPGAAATPASTLHPPSIDGLVSGTFAPRWAPANLAEMAAVQAPATARIDTALGSTGWGDAFQQKIVWLVDRQQQHAELHVNPPHLGPIEITLNLGEEATHIAFTSPHAAVREAIEASLPELRTALGEKGLALGQASVGSDSQAAREQLRGEARAGSAGGRNGGLDAPAEVSLPPRVVARGLVDIFA
jgi:flagellar hook-length control protein FliK